MSASCSAARTMRCSRTGCTCRSAITAAPRRSCVSGTKVRRPRGQLKPPTAEVPSFGPCKRLDFELEMGVVVGQPSPMGEMLTEAQAEEMIFGFVILNDWSARDIQQWEYVPLGPFQAKAFGTSISPWIVTREALEPFRVHGPAQDPEPLPYLRQAQPNNYDMELDVALRAGSDERGAKHLPHQFQIHVLVVGAATRAPCFLRLRHECRRSPGERHDLRPGEAPARQSVGDQLERHRAGRTCRRRQAHVPRRRRFARHARLVPGRRLSRRLWRSRGHDYAGGDLTAPPARISRSFAECAATSSRLYFRCTRLSDGGCLATHTPGPPLGGGPDRPRHKAAAAVRADIVQLVVGAIRAERAFVGADPRFRCIRRQVLVAIFAVRPKLQRHDRLLVLMRGRMIANRARECE